MYFIYFERHVLKFAFQISCYVKSILKIPFWKLCSKNLKKLLWKIFRTNNLKVTFIKCKIIILKLIGVKLDITGVQEENSKDRHFL